MTVRVMRFFSRASVVGAVHTVLRSVASVASDINVVLGAGASASWKAILLSISDTRASALEIACERLAHLISPLTSFPLGGNRSLDGTRSDDSKESFFDGIVDAQPSKGDAARFAIVQPAAAAAVAWDIVLRAGVAKRQLTAAAAAADQAREQRVAVLRSAVMAAGGNVVADHPANRLGLLPADVALMGVRHQRQPIGPRLAAHSDADSEATIVRRHGRLAIGIGTAVDRVLDHPVDGGIAWTSPRRDSAFALDGQIEAVLEEPQQSLPGATEFQHLVEDQRDRRLDAPIRVLLVTVADLYEPDRRTDHELATARLLVARRQGSLAQ